MRKNVASQVVSARLIALSDGTAVTSGTTTVYVTLSGGTQASGSGTVTHEGNGEWSYVPTQAETNSNQVSFMFTNSLSVGALVNVYPVAFDPTDSVRAGLTALPNATPAGNGGLLVIGANLVGASGFTILNGSNEGFSVTNGGVVQITGDFGITGSIVLVDGSFSDIPFDGDELTQLKTTITRGATVLPTSGTIPTVGTGSNQIALSSGSVTVGTNSDKTGYSLTATTGLGNQTANITGNLSGSVGSVTGAVTVGTINANVLTASALATDAVTEIQSGLATASALSTAQTDLTTLTGRLTSTRAGYLDNLSAGAVATAASLTTVAGYVDTEVAAIKAVTDKVDTALVLDGAVYQFTINALENAPSGSGASASAIADAVWDELLSGHTTTGSAGAELTAAAAGGGGGSTVYLSPLQTSVISPVYTVNGATTWPLDLAQNSTPAILFAVTDGDGLPVSLSGKTVRLVAHNANKPFTTIGELQTGGAGITIGGTDNNQVTATFTTNITGSVYSGAYKLWNVTDAALLSEGPLVIRPAPIDHV